MPRRSGIPLLCREIDPEGRGQEGASELETRCSLDFFGERPPDVVRDIHLAALEHRQACAFIGDAPEYQPLDGWHLAPETLVRLEDELDARREGHESVGASSDGCLLEPLVTHALHIVLWDDPARSRGWRAEERHEVGPWFLETDPHPARIDDLDGRDLFLEELGGGAAIPLDRELDVVGGHHVAVVESDVLPQHELVGEPVP